MLAFLVDKTVEGRKKNGWEEAQLFPLPASIVSGRVFGGKKSVTQKRRDHLQGGFLQHENSRVRAPRMYDSWRYAHCSSKMGGTFEIW